MPTMTTTNWLTAAEAAAYLKINIDTIHRLAAAGEIKRYGKPRMYRYNQTDLDRYMQQHPKQA